MRSIHVSAMLTHQRYALLSHLRSQGLELILDGATAPRAGDLMLVADGERVAHPTRTLSIGGEGRYAEPARDGQPARLAYPPEDAALGAGFARALLAPDTPTAADPETMALHALAERVARSDITVLINGPTGTGKEVLARHLHHSSPRRDGPFIAINCAALPESMLEALLFGHQKGAFTGASSGGEGFFRAAHGGTLLLDEIAELPLQLQAKLLRALQEREVIPIGASQPIAVDVRVIACANRDLHDEVAAGRFRADLFYRLSVFPLTTLPLVDRPRDIPALVATMIVRHAGNRVALPWPDAAALDRLTRHDWPGNVRELENVVQRALLFAAGDTIGLDHIVFDRRATAPAPIPDPATDGRPATLGDMVQVREFQAIREALTLCGGNRVETARRLGISERTLRYRLAKARGNGALSGADGARAALDRRIWA